MAERTEPRITLHPHSRRVRILAGDSLLAEICNAIAWRERGYPLRLDLQKEIPRADVDMSKLYISSTVTHHPFKGDANYNYINDIANVA